jgi:flagellar L-ring protein precursor FlgH
MTNLYFSISRMVIVTSLVVNLPACGLFAKGKASPKEPAPRPVSVIDQLLTQSNGMSPLPAQPTPGSAYTNGGVLTDITSDVHARVVGDLVTIVVLDQASATSQGATSQKRNSSANSSISSLFGLKSAHNALNNLANINGTQQLDGQGTTSRQTTVSTTVSSRVLKVLANGDLVVEGNKLIAINSEYQTVTLRGIVRPVDLGSTNSVSSNQVEDLEVRINGRGVVNDAIRRPNFLYRLFLGLLPF